MKISIINGCTNKNFLESDTVNEICKYFNKKKLNYDLSNLENMELKHCIGCDSCQNLNPGICCIDDGINNILKQFLNSDISIIITPIQFGCYNSVTKSFIDRTQPLFLSYQRSKNGKTIMKPRYKNYPNIIFVGIMQIKDTDSEENFKETVLKCNLSEASNKVSIKIITEKSKFMNFNEFQFI